MCAPPGHNIKNMRELAEAYAGREGVSAIFVGRVEKQEVNNGNVSPGNAFSMTSSGRYRQVTLSVSEAFRGKLGSTAKVITNYDEAGCGFDFETGKEYLVYASADSSGAMSTSLCSGTELAEHSGPALRQLRGQPAAPEDLVDQETYFKQMYPKWTGRICGHVYFEGKPLGGASVDLTQIREDGFPPRGASDPDTSKPDGSYCIPMVEPGRYTLSAGSDDYDHDKRSIAYWPGGTDPKAAQTIEVAAGQSASWYDMQLLPQDLYRIAIRVAVGNGRPAPESIGVYLSSIVRDPRGYSLDRQQPTDGIYFFAYVPPGKYKVQTFPAMIYQKDGTPKMSPDALKWKMADLELPVSQNMNLTIKLDPSSPDK